MPLIREKQIDSIARLSIWDMTESREELLKIADPDDSYLQSLEEVTHPKRRRELFGLKALLKTINFQTRIDYLSNGKPVVPGQGHISISHCDQLAGFLHSDLPCGMDIQNPNRKISIIAPRFCNDEELQEAEEYDDPLLYHMALWSIKESIFKVFGEDLPFADQILVKRFDPKTSEFVDVNCIYRGQAFHFKVRIHREGAYFVMMAFLE